MRTACIHQHPVVISTSVPCQQQKHQNRIHSLRPYYASSVQSLQRLQRVRAVAQRQRQPLHQRRHTIIITIIIIIMLSYRPLQVVPQFHPQFPCRKVLHTVVPLRWAITTHRQAIQRFQWCWFHHLRLRHRQRYHLRQPSHRQRQPNRYHPVQVLKPVHIFDSQTIITVIICLAKIIHKSQPVPTSVPPHWLFRPVRLNNLSTDEPILIIPIRKLIIWQNSSAGCSI